MSATTNEPQATSEVVSVSATGATNQAQPASLSTSATANQTQAASEVLKRWTAVMAAADPLRGWTEHNAALAVVLDSIPQKERLVHVATHMPPIAPSASASAAAGDGHGAGAHSLGTHAAEGHLHSPPLMPPMPVPLSSLTSGDGEGEGLESEDPSTSTTTTTTTTTTTATTTTNSATSALESGIASGSADSSTINTSPTALSVADENTATESSIIIVPTDDSTAASSDARAGKRRRVASKDTSNASAPTPAHDDTDGTTAVGRAYGVLAMLLRSPSPSAKMLANLDDEVRAVLREILRRQWAYIDSIDHEGHGRVAAAAAEVRCRKPASKTDRSQINTLEIARDLLAIQPKPP
jgi:hypothetical protein